MSKNQYKYLFYILTGLWACWRRYGLCSAERQLVCLWEDEDEDVVSAMANTLCVWKRPTKAEEQEQLRYFVALLNEEDNLLVVLREWRARREDESRSSLSIEEEDEEEEGGYWIPREFLVGINKEERVGSVPVWLFGVWDSSLNFILFLFIHCFNMIL